MKTLLIIVSCLLIGQTVNSKNVDRKSAHDVDYDSSTYQRQSQKQTSPVNAIELNTRYWLDIGDNFVKAQQNKKINTNRAKNVIFFIGDGMSIPTIAATRNILGGEEAKLFFEQFPHTGMVKTYCVDAQVADSACSSTAYMTGVKGNDGTIGVNAKVNYGDCGKLNEDVKTDSIAKWFMDANRVAGIVTTTRVTHASPVGAYGHIAKRGWESDTDIDNDKANNCDSVITDDIAEQLVRGDVGSKLKVILGGGGRNFIPKNETNVDYEMFKGLRSDGVNLIDEWLGADEVGRKFVTNRDDLNSVKADEIDSLFGIFESSHMLYHLEAKATGKADQQPTLSEMTKKAIEVLSNDESGYFLFVEGGKIDLAHHDNQARMSLDECAELSLAVELARSMTSEEDTLIVVSSDHSHVMSYNGYPDRHNQIFDITGDLDEESKVPEERLSYKTLSYANGPGYKNSRDSNGRIDPEEGDKDKLYNYQFPATLNLLSETHGGDDVAVFASGPYSHLFTGTYEQNVLPHLMAYASCVGDYSSDCNIKK